MHIFDSHLDLALNGVDWNRDLTLSVDEIRRQEKLLEMCEQPGRCTNTVSLPELRNAGIHTCLATLLARQEPEVNHDFGWISPTACYAMAHSHLAYYRALELDGHVRLLRSQSELSAHRNQVETDVEVPQNRIGMHKPPTPLGIILTMEGADPLLTADTIFEFYALGLRAIGLTHYGTNRYGGGTESEVGLHSEARPLLEHIEQLGMALDLTHLSDQSFWQVLDLFTGRVHASHQNSRRLSDWQRQFTDEQYCAVIERNGVVGIAMDLVMLQNNYVRGKSPKAATMETIVENIDIVCQLAGNANHVGIGSDLDGGYGNEQTPLDLERISDLRLLADRLRQRGYSTEDIAAVLQGNWFRFFSEALPA